MPTVSGHKFAPPGFTTNSAANCPAASAGATIQAREGESHPAIPAQIDNAGSSATKYSSSSQASRWCVSAPNAIDPPKPSANMASQGRFLKRDSVGKVAPLGSKDREN